MNAKKREQILQIAEELGYHPNPVAMSLMTQRTKQILFYCKDMRNAFNIEVYRGMLAAAGQQDYMVVVNGTLDFRKVKGIMADGLILPNETIADLYLEATGKNYHEVLDYTRFVSVSARRFAKMQSDIIRRYLKPGDFITTNGLFGNLDNHAMRRESLDFMTYDSYPNFAYCLDMYSDNPKNLRDRKWSRNLTETRSVSPVFVIME